MFLRVNLISSLDENSRLEKLSSPNQIYAWFLNKALLAEGVDSYLVKGQKIIKAQPPETDHTIVTSTAAYSRMHKTEGYRERLRKSTREKLVCYVNTDLRERANFFDYVLTQMSPLRDASKKYIHVGWGVDPEYCYPEQKEKAAFLDSKTPTSHTRIMKPIYDIYDKVLPTLTIKTYNPVPIYNKDKRIPWPQYQAILRKCHYFLCTQLGEGGLNRLEAAACGALLIVPKKLRRRRTFGSLNHDVFRTEEDLVRLLNMEVDIEANRKRALKHRWEDVAKRIIEALET